MSVVHGLTVGWLVDHLSFINQCGYEICDSFAHPGGVTHSTSVTSTEDCYSISTFAATPSSSDGPPFDPGDAVEAEGRRAKMRSVFWEEFLDISKPYIAAACEEQLCPALRKVKGNVCSTKVNWMLWNTIQICLFNKLNQLRTIRAVCTRI